jgi:hypothetical protein
MAAIGAMKLALDTLPVFFIDLQKSTVCCVYKVVIAFVKVICLHAFR